MLDCLCDFRVNMLKLSNGHHHVIFRSFNMVCSKYASLTVYAVSVLP